MNPNDPNTQQPGVSPQPSVSPPSGPAGMPQEPAPMPGGTPVPVNNPQYPQSSGQVSESKKKWLIPLVVLLVLLAIGGGVLAMKGKDKSDKQPSTVITTDQSITPQPEAKDTTPTMAKIPINQTITTDLGYKVVASELVRNYTAKHPTTGKEVVLVKVTITEENSQYTGSSPYSTDFKLLVSDTEYGGSLTVSSKELTDAGYATLPAESATKAKPTSGYIAFDVPTGTDKLSLRYIQKERKVLGSSQSIPAKNYDVALN